MIEDNYTVNFNDELKKIIDETDIHGLLPALKEKARNVDFSLRRQFEDALLDAARGATQGDKRNIIYESLASLAAVWNENKPKKGLTQAFHAHFTAGKYEQARQIYGELLKQGLDHVGSVEIETGTILPCSSEKKPGLLMYNDHDISILSPGDLNTIKKLVSFDNAQILDVLPPTVENREDNDAIEIDKNLWVLIREQNGKKAIVAIDMDDNTATIPLLRLEKVKETAVRLSRFQGRLLLICPNSIYYHSLDDGWREWLPSKTYITHATQVKDAYWVVFADGTIYLQKSIERVGVRKKIEFQPIILPRIEYSDRFVVISYTNLLNIANFEGSLIQAPIAIGSKIIQFLVLNDTTIAVLLANGSIAGVDVNQGQITWQIYLDSHYDAILRSGRYIYCVQNEGRALLFELPNFSLMADLLEKENIQVPERPIEREPTDPVRYITEFIGRKELLIEIKEAGKMHFLVFGEPKIGKTSLLNVLSDLLSENSNGCHIDMDQLLQDVNTYEDYEARFIEMCLSQHVLKVTDLEDIHGYQPYRELVEKIRGEKNFFLLCLDNFIVPPTDRYSKRCLDRFGTFFKEMFTHPNVRMIITARAKDRLAIENYLEYLRLDTSKHGYQKRISLPFLAEDEVKNALRIKLTLNQEEVEEIYKYTGGFPNHIHLFDKWKKEEKSIDEYSKEIAKNFRDNIFQYFKDLSRDAYLLISLCLNEDLISKKVGFKKFYESYPLLNKLLPKDSVIKALGEINNYGKSFTTIYWEDSFSINMSGNANLFFEASFHIKWLQVFLILCKFSCSPNPQNAAEIVSAFSKMVKIRLSDSDLMDEQTSQYKDTFYIKRLTREGRHSLGMPLPTFLVIPLKPWDKERIRQDFTSLFISIQEFVRKSREAMLDDTLSSKFYILIFELHGTAFDNIKKSIKGLERVSVIDSPKMVDILLDVHPREKSSEYIFSQLNISERSPYTTSGAVPDELFFGRELEIALIRGLSENIGIFGTRTIGKTSILLKINRDIESQKKWKTFALDCSRIDSQESLLKNLAEKMNVPYETISDLEKFRKYVAEEAARDDIQYLFLLDEVDRLVECDTGPDEKIFKTFNKMCSEILESGKTAARFILFGFHQMFEQMKNPESRLYNFMVFLPLKPLDDKSALALVTQPMRNIRVKWQNEDQDAGYLVENCSGHPLLLQTACQSLLAILDGKKENKDMIERRDVDSALFSDQFQQICMRFYPAAPRKNETFLNDIHRIAILSGIRLQVEKNKETFTFTDIYNKLKSCNIEISPGIIRNILDHLRLSGVFRFMNEATLLAREDTAVQEEAEQEIKNVVRKKDDITGTFKVDKPDVYASGGEIPSEFTYAFAIKIFPKLLMTNLGGPNRCNEELQRLVKKGDWKEWLRRQ